MGNNVLSMSNKEIQKVYIMRNTKQHNVTLRLILLTLVLVCTASLAFVIGMATYTMVAKDYSLYIQESECVSEYISKGVERSNIATGDGTCWVK